MNNICFSHVALNCNDPIKIEQFYCKHFGFKRSRVYEPGPDQVVMIKLGDCYVELYSAQGKPPLPAPEKDGYAFAGVRHFCLSVSDLDGLLKQIAQDADLSLGPLDMSQYVTGMKVAWIKDPEGNVVELNQGYQDQLNPPEIVVNNNEVTDE